MTVHRRDTSDDTNEGRKSFIDYLEDKYKDEDKPVLCENQHGYDPIFLCALECITE